MAKGSGAAVLGFMLIGVLAVALLFGGQIIGFVSGLPDYIQDWIDSIRGTFPGAGGDVEGQTWIGYTVHYTDGTSDEVREEAPTFSLFPLSITFGGKTVSSVSVNLKAQLYGDIGSWSGVMSMQTEAYKKPESVPKTSATANYTKEGSTWMNGEIKVLASYTVLASTLEQLADTYGEGEWQLQFLASVQLTVHVDGVPIMLNAASPAGGMDFTYDEGVDGLSVFGGSETW